MAKSRKPIVGCTVKELPPESQADAAATAVAVNPANRPSLFGLAAIMATAFEPGAGVLPPGFLAVLHTKYWGSKGVRLSVSFMETTSRSLADKIISHLNAWGVFCNARFEFTQGQGQVRISRGPGGYWSYLGTDVLSIPADRPTMNLQGFTLNTPESEYVRVVRHEAGHTLGFPHEHARRAIVEQLDVARTVAYFRRTQGWSETQVRQQVLTPLEESAIIGSPGADETSLMTYQLPASITRDGQPILGGMDFSATDRAFAARLYPLAVSPPPPADGVRRVVLEVAGRVDGVRLVEGG